MLKISWDDYHGMLKVLDVKIQQAAHPSVDNRIHLVGIPRGGTLVALHLSYLNPAYTVDLDVFNTKRNLNSPSVVVVDDVLETGKTRRDVMNKDGVLECLNCFAVLVDKSNVHGTEPADVSVMRLDSKIWIEFPYENVLDPKEITSRKERGYGHDE